MDNSGFFRLILVLLLTGLSQFALNFAEAQTLIFNDEFNGSILDNDIWEQPEYNRRNNDHGPDGWWLKEDSYLDGNGNLVIRVKEIQNQNSDEDSLDYSTGAIRTRGNFEQTFGKFEIRCKLPSQAGWWVAFWLLSPTVGSVDGTGKDGVEVDIFEGFGWTDRVQHALHWDGYGTEHQSTSADTTLPGIRQGYHTFTLEWRPDIYIFLIDGHETWRTNSGGVCQVPAYIKITGELSTESWAVNQWWANDPRTATYPDSFLVDYVRVWAIHDTVATIDGKSPVPDCNLGLTNYPNPFRSSTKIKYALTKPAEVVLNIYNLNGKKIKQLDRGFQKPGEYEILWKPKNMPCGIYFYKLRAGSYYFETKKMILLK